LVDMLGCSRRQVNEGRVLTSRVPTASGHLGFLTFFFRLRHFFRPHRSTRPIAVQPSIFPIPCLLLNLFRTAMLFFPVFAELQPPIVFPPYRNRLAALSLRPTAHSRHSTPLLSNACGLLLHNGRPQLLCFQSLPDSFHRNGGVYPPIFFSSAT
jgi:hypothetical protein